MAEKARSRSSPRVVITPKLGRLGSIQSRYFAKDKGKDKGDGRVSRREEEVEEEEEDDGEEDPGSGEDEDLMEDEEDEDEEDEESEEEIVKPRATTARTRKSLLK